MNCVAKCRLLLLTGIGLVAFGFNAHADQKLAFNFQLNHPLVYSYDIDTKTVVNQSGQFQGRPQSMSNRTTVDKHYKIRFTPVRKNPDGSWTIHFEPIDFSMDEDAVGNSGHNVLSMHGMEVTGTQNGVPVIDTAKGIGEIQAAAVKHQVYPDLLGGYFDFDSSGKVIRIDGDLPFIDTMTNALKLKIGFFDILLPDKAIGQGYSWQEVLALKDLQGLKLGNIGLTETNTFSLLQPPASENNSMATIDRAVALDLKNLTGSVDGVGQSTTVNISELKDNVSGTVRFDAAHGEIVELTNDEAAHTTSSMMIMGTTANSDMDFHETRKYTLLPADQ